MKIKAIAATVAVALLAFATAVQAAAAKSGAGFTLAPDAASAKTGQQIEMSSHRRRGWIFFSVGV